MGYSGCKNFSFEGAIKIGRPKPIAYVVVVNHTKSIVVIEPVSKTRVLWLLVLSQFACISLWFAGNSVISDLIREFSMVPGDVGYLTSAVQSGFIGGTLVFAYMAIADRHSPSKVFLASAIIAALCNSLMIFSNGNLWIMYGSRFLTGVFLAGIYPVGMKIAADYFSKDLGKALGYLVGALVLGTAFPHLLKHFQTGLPWKTLMLTTSFLSVLGGLIVYLFIPDGPYRVKAQGFKNAHMLHAFKSKPFRAAAFGYFGHMWEVYSFWAFVPFILSGILISSGKSESLTSLYAFIMIAMGGLGCVGGGYLARKYGSYKVALVSLIYSGVCCLLSPVLFHSAGLLVSLVFLALWGATVVMDSPQFSAMVAGFAPDDNRGTTLTIVTCIGFSITIVSIQLLAWMIPLLPAKYLFTLLIPGPVFGVFSMLYFSNKETGQDGTLS
jgi:MFS family permease